MTQATAIVLQIADFRKPAKPLTPREKRFVGKKISPAKTETAKNSRLRTARRDAWWIAGRVTDYWRVRVDWQFELESAQKRMIGDSGSFPPAKDEDRCVLVAAWRKAVARQLLTPAPDLAAITWKRAKLGSGLNYMPIAPEVVQQAIDDDVAFLAAHPVRQSKREA